MVFTWLVGCAWLGTAKPMEVPGLALVPVVEGVERTTGLAWWGPTMVLIQQEGVVSVVQNGVAKPWLDLKSLPDGLKVLDGGEQGLLGLALAPDVARSGRLVLSWTAKRGTESVSTVATFTTDPAVAPGAAPLVLERVVFQITQPYANHNGGDVHFGPDGMLYLGLGDGGSGGDPLGSGQNGATPLGAMLRFDLALPAPHIPADNPFVSDPKVHDAIFALGLRNPWRFTFSPDGRLIAGDVGQSAWEEITEVPRGANLGWNIKEGHACYEVATCEGAFVEPMFDYPRDKGQSVTGGVFLPDGRYVFADFVSGRFWALKVPAVGTRATEVQELGELGVNPSTFGRDGAGAVYVADYMKGGIYRVDAAP